MDGYGVFSKERESVWGWVCRLLESPERERCHASKAWRGRDNLYDFFGSRKHQSSNRIYEMTSLREFGITARVNGRYRSNRDFDRAWCCCLLGLTSSTFFLLSHTPSAVCVCVCVFRKNICYIYIYM